MCSLQLIISSTGAATGYKAVINRRFQDQTWPCPYVEGCSVLVYDFSDAQTYKRQLM